jgi:hypothetical protein
MPIESNDSFAALIGRVIDRWNSLAVEAVRLGIPGVKLHKTETRPGDFATYSIARARVAWLEAKIKAAKVAAAKREVSAE